MSSRNASPKQKQPKNRKRKREDAEDIPQSHDEQPQTTEELQQAMSERLERIRKTYLNKQRVLVLCSRGITFRFRHLMQDILDLLPHTKKDVKLDTKDKLWMINEICEMKNCNNSIFFEVRKKQDLYMWIAKAPNGPSVKFHVLNVHTMMELKFTGNCLKGSRPLLSFDPAFESTPELQLMKEIFTQVFGTPKGHPKSKPFFDHVFSFYIADGKIWFRNYQIAEEVLEGKKPERVLVEIGPRFVLDPIKIVSGSFSGAPIYENPNFVSPNAVRSFEKKKKSLKYANRVAQTVALKSRKEDLELEPDEVDQVFQ
eukprot:TRINITY_DN1760_c0_g1_i1.p1 TRINITY_DN1760_c0_g1~~TRINITY_DN1760_c0_g1_i1.p1  ORF type:complete len:324 (-),score=70.30 TRINITY_DN1760_c0_g1_i1:27-965(-)